MLKTGETILIRRKKKTLLKLKRRRVECAFLNTRQTFKMSV